jgi:hypothetical protein
MRSFACLLIVCVAGCSSSGPPAPKLYPVTGSLMVDGKPIPDTTVMLTPVDLSSKAQPAIGRTDSEGKFKISTNGNRGATSGQFKVVLVPDGEVAIPDPTTSANEDPNTKSKNSYIASMEAKTKPKPVLKFPKEWTAAKTSPKTIEVKEEALVMDIDI